MQTVITFIRARDDKGNFILVGDAVMMPPPEVETFEGSLDSEGNVAPMSENPDFQSGMDGMSGSDMPSGYVQEVYNNDGRESGEVVRPPVPSRPPWDDELKWEAYCTFWHGNFLLTSWRAV